MSIDNHIKIVTSVDLEIGTGVLTSDNIFTVRIQKSQKVSMRTIDIGMEFIREFGGGPYLNLFIFDTFADVDSDVRDWAAGPEGNTHSMVDAIVISGLPQKIIADFYLKFNKPIKPTKVFRDEVKAREWLLTFSDTKL